MSRCRSTPITNVTRYRAMAQMITTRRQAGRSENITRLLKNLRIASRRRRLKYKMAGGHPSATDRAEYTTVPWRPESEHQTRGCRTLWRVGHPSETNRAEYTTA